jgi:multidrug efflux pump subunit AcrA (membrane-fusion protein)
MTEDKSKLLRSLSIDRSAKAERPKSRWLPVSAAIVACVVAFAAFGAYEFSKQEPVKETASQIAQQQPAARPPTAPPPQQATANSKPAGSLAASGYVVARRKATVAAEITGKVVEVFIDEGMTVTEGQVVARLDSVLAEKDFELARSRVETADAAVAAITADLEDATRIMTRVQTLSQKNFATEADLTKAQARVGVLSAQLRQAQSQFETAKIDAKRSGSMLDKHQIRAPFAGVVIDRSAQPG